MQLNMTTDYAVRILLYLGMTNRVTSSGEIAEEMAIPANYVPNIIKKLRDRGLVNAKYGPKGGYELGKDAGTISLLDVVQTMEGAIRISRELKDDDNSARNVPAQQAVQSAYQDIQDGLEKSLGDKTIGQLVAASAKA